jgi:hypothetical protein
MSMARVHRYLYAVMWWCNGPMPSMWWGHSSVLYVTIFTRFQHRGGYRVLRGLDGCF